MLQNHQQVLKKSAFFSDLGARAWISPHKAISEAYLKQLFPHLQFDTQPPRKKTNLKFIDFLVAPRSCAARDFGMLSYSKLCKGLTKTSWTSTTRQDVPSRSGSDRINGSMVGDRINGIFHLHINGVYWGYKATDPNNLLTSWDILAGQHFGSRAGLFRGTLFRHIFDAKILSSVFSIQCWTCETGIKI